MIPVPHFSKFGAIQMGGIIEELIGQSPGCVWSRSDCCTSQRITAATQHNSSGHTVSKVSTSISPPGSSERRYSFAGFIFFNLGRVWAWAQIFFLVASKLVVPLMERIGLFYFSSGF